MRKLLAMVMLITVLPTVAQEMSVAEFSRQKNSRSTGVSVKKDKKNAILLLSTDEKGFQFKADAKTDVKAEEGDGLLTLRVPNKTRWLSITHPDYGQLTWRVPGKGLRKKKVYHAYLKAYNPDKEYKLKKQWVVLQIEPQSAIVRVDSVTTIVRDGRIQYHLPIGKHPYMVEAPFFKTVEDTLELADAQKLVLPVMLQPIYSYLTVKTPSEACRIYVDNELIGQHEAVSSHLSPGTHRLAVFIGSLCYYDAPVTLGESMKKVVELTQEDLQLRFWVEKRPIAAQVVADSTSQAASQQPAASSGQAADQQSVAQKQPVSQQSAEPDPLAGVILPPNSIAKMPQATTGYLNIHSNVMEAAVYVDGKQMGATPCTIGGLNAGKTYTVRLEHQSYKPVEQQVLVLGNDLVDVEMLMSRKGHKEKKR